MLEKLQRVEFLLRRYQSYSFRFYGPAGNPLRGQGRVLSILKMKPQITQKELSYLLDMRPQSLSELLAKLERQGYIKREPLEEDRRVATITLTPEGQEASLDADEKDFNIQRVVGSLSEEEQQQLAAALDKLTAALEKELEDAGMCKKGYDKAKYHPPGQGHPHGPHHGGHCGPHGHGQGCKNAGGGPHGGGHKHPGHPEAFHSTWEE